jgi:hypothetical protein
MTLQDDKAPAPLAELKEAIRTSATPDTIKEALNRLEIRADAKAVAMQIASVAVKIGGSMLSIGRLIIDVAIKFAGDYPNTTFALILSIVVTMLIAMIPWIGPFLAGVIGPLLGALTILIGGISDWRTRALLMRVRLLNQIDSEAAASQLSKGLLKKMEPGESADLLSRIQELEKRFGGSDREPIELKGATRVE